MKTQNTVLKVLSSVALTAAIALAILIQAATTANAQTAAADSTTQEKTVQFNPSQPQPAAFSVASLKGGYGWNSVAFNNYSTSQPSAGAGLMIFDGQGNFGGHYTGSFLGVPGSTTNHGTYTVNPDGSGHMHFQQGNGAVQEYDLFIVDGGKEIFMVNTNPGTLQIVHVKKQ